MYEEDSGIITDRFLGSFKRGEFRPPMKGEYYLCEYAMGIGCSIDDKRTPKRILVPVK